MDSIDLMDALNRKTFHPVELHLTDGRTLRVEHPDYFLMFPTKKSALVFPDGVHSELVDIAAITRAVPIEKSQQSTGAPPQN